MNHSDTIEKLKFNMIDYYKGDPKRIHHFIKVHSFARLIGSLEKLGGEDMFILECAALVHDIGIRPAERKYGKCDGKLQEQEGAEPARKMLTALEIDNDVIERVCFLVSHHHTYNHIDGMDYRILVEADFIVNLYEDNASVSAIKSALKNIFQTKSGTEILMKCFNLM